MSRYANPSSAAEEMWAAVVRRDPEADGKFYYSVLTTGVYCRPSCAARQPRRENVAFHRDAAAAERAGFRPCKRCLPNEPTLAVRNAAVVAKACRLIEESQSAPSLATLAEGVGMNPFRLHRVFKAVTGLTPKAYASAERAARLRNGLRGGDTVTEALHRAGFGSSGRLYAASDKLLGMRPSQYRAGGDKIAIRFAVGQSTLGAVLVAASEKGICAISLGDDAETLVEQLHEQFPAAQLLGGDAEFETWVAQVVGFVDDPRIGLNLPLDIQGTAFQQRVWQALSEIPAGSTASYGEIAECMGSPESSRAVAAACAANRIAVAIPCHRIIRRDGSVSGYRWGVDRKKALLRAEGKSAVTSWSGRETEA